MNKHPFTQSVPTKGSFEWLLNEAKQKGFVFVDSRFLIWTDSNLGKPVGDIIRLFLANTKQWMVMNSLSDHQISFDELINYAFLAHPKLSELKLRIASLKLTPISDDIKNPVDTISQSEFKKWFGKSAITTTGEPDGAPLVVYHGTANKFSEIKPSSHGEYGPGVYLSFNESTAAKWGAIAGGRGGSIEVLSFYLKMVNPYRTTKLDLQELTLEEDEDSEPIGMREVHRRLKSEGYDGIIGTGLTESDVQIIAFEASQVLLKDSIVDDFELTASDDPVVYHGTPNSFNTFDTFPAFFTNDYSVAEAYAKNQYAREGETGDPRVIAANVIMNNPKIFTNDEIISQFQTDDNEIDWYQFEQSLYAIEDNGFDGVIVRDVMDYAGNSNGQRISKHYDQYIAFGPNQIKIVDANCDNPDMENKLIEFKEWFSGSIMKYENETPMVLYHGTRPNNDIHEFRVSKHDGAYFTPDINYAEGFIEGLFEERGSFGAVYPVYLSVKNPYIVRTEPDTDEWENFVYRGLDKEKLEKEGYDSAILYLENELDQVIAFYPEQIRFVLANNIDFNKSNQHQLDSTVTSKKLTESSIMIYIGTHYPRLVKAAEALLDKGKRGEYGGVYLIDSNKSSDACNNQFTSVKNKNQIRTRAYDEGGITYIISDKLTKEEGASILIQKITHNANTKALYECADQLLICNDVYPDATKSFIDRVQNGMKAFDNGNDRLMALGHIIGHAIIEHITNPTKITELDEKVFEVN